MKLEIINNLLNNTKDNNFIQNFMKELSDYLVKENNKLKEKDSNANDLIEENQLYQVVDRSLNGVYLQNMKNNKVFEETNMPKDILEKIGNDYILRYKNGEYIFEEELTDEFFDGIDENE